MGLPFGLVGVQQPFRREPAEHEVQPPFQADGVTDPGYEALPEERRHDVRRVARQQDASRPPLPRHEGPELEHGRALQVPLVWGHAEEPHHLPGAVGGGEAGFVVAGQQHELEALALVADPEQAPRPFRIADLRVVVLELQRCERRDVIHRPFLLETQIGDTAAELLAHEAVGAVGADNIARAHLTAGRGFRPSAVRVLLEAGGRDLDCLAGLRHLLHLVAHVDLDAGQEADPRGQRVLDVGLVGEVVRRPPGDLVPVPVEAHEQFVPAVAELVGGRTVRIGLEILGRPDGLDDAHRLVVQVAGAGSPVELGPALEDHDAIAALTQHGGEQLAHRPVADDRDIDHLSFVLVHRSLLISRETRGRARSSDAPDLLVVTHVLAYRRGQWQVVLR